MARNTSAAAGASASNRLVSVDAYRGFVMLAMASGGLGLAGVAARNPNWAGVARQFDHPAWLGCVFWDLIQPSFMFIVGVSMVMSYAARQGQGQTWARQCLHVVKRAGLLCLVGMFLDWYSAGTIFVQFIRVLQQIAIGYVIAFAVLPLGPKVQAVTAILLLIGHTAAYLLYGSFTGMQDPWIGYTLASEGARPDYLNVTQNFGRRLDALLHLPLARGGYVTFNAVSSAATILFGVLAGELLRSPATVGRKVGVLVVAGFAGLAIGWGLSGGGGWIPLEFTAQVPMIKRLWTASFAIFAAGWTCLMLAAFFGVIEGLGFKAWTMPFVVVGMNSIAMYVIAGVFPSNAQRIARLIVPNSRAQEGTTLSDLIPVVDFSNWSLRWGVDLREWYLTPLVESLIVLSIYWLACYWLYRRQIFFKL